MPGAPEFSTDRVSLTQVDDRFFHLNRDFTYTAADGTTHAIKKSALNVDGTDLASVPSILWWYVGSYGRHTRPALLHDFLVRTWPPEDRPKADALFREALTLCKVPPLRRGLMWTAVSLETTFRRIRSNRWAGVLIVLVNLAMATGAAVVAAHRMSPWWLFCFLAAAAIGVFLLSWKHPGEALLVDHVALIIGSLAYWLIGEKPWWQLALFALSALSWLVWRWRCGWMIFGIIIVLPPSALNWIVRVVTGGLEYVAFAGAFAWWWLVSKRKGGPTPPAPEPPKGPFRPTRVRPWLSAGP